MIFRSASIWLFRKYVKTPSIRQSTTILMILLTIDIINMIHILTIIIIALLLCPLILKSFADFRWVGASLQVPIDTLNYSSNIFIHP